MNCLKKIALPYRYLEEFGRNSSRSQVRQGAQVRIEAVEQVIPMKHTRRTPRCK
jgi:hypothetical protein